MALSTSSEDSSSDDSSSDDSAGGGAAFFAGAAFAFLAGGASCEDRSNPITLLFMLQQVPVTDVCPVHYRQQAAASNVSSGSESCSLPRQRTPPPLMTPLRCCFRQAARRPANAWCDNMWPRTSSVSTMRSVFCGVVCLLARSMQTRRMFASLCRRSCTIDNLLHQQTTHLLAGSLGRLDGLRWLLVAGALLLGRTRLGLHRERYILTRN